MRLLLIVLSLTLFADHPFFFPPSGWEIARPKEPNPYVQIGFLGKGATDFRPSISLATEQIDTTTLKEYMKSVKEIHLSERKQYRDLGKFAMKGGEGRLIELTEKNGWGVVKMLQAILIKEGTAYLLTGAVLKDEFPKFQTVLLDSFRTLDVIAAVSAPIADDQKRKEFEHFYSALGISNEKDQQWQQLQAQVKHFSDLGSYWQFLALQEGHDKIFTSKESPPDVK